MPERTPTEYVSMYWSLGGFFLVHPAKDWDELSENDKATFLRIVTPKQAALEAVVLVKPEEHKEHEVFWLAPIKVWETFFLILAAIAAAYYIRGK